MNKDQIIANLQHSNEVLKHEIAMLKKLIFGSKSEKHKPTPVDDNQLSMFADLEEDPAPQEVQSTEVKGYTKKTKKHAGRQPLPDHLPVEEIIIEPTEDTSQMEKIGEQVTEVLEYTPATLFRRRYIRPKYVSPKGNIVVAAMPDRPLPKSIAESGLLTHIIVNKFVDHLPFYRQIERLKRDHQVTIPSSTINDWFVAVCTLLKPLYDKLREKTLATHYLQGDESPISVMDSDKKGKTHQGYQWVYHNPLDKLILFDYRKGRGMHGPKEVLKDYTGILQCDGYSVYDKIAKKGNITIVGCLAHVRRKYVEAKGSDTKLANIALDIFAEIYRHEKIAKASEDRKAYRDEHVLPLLHKLKAWIDEESIKVLPKSPIGKAMRYTINQWPKVIGILQDSFIELDNNLIENKIRPLALGRKNYLFAGSHSGAQRIAMMYSFFATCKANDINPAIWLKQTLDHISTTSIQNLDKLIPGYSNM